MMRGRPSLLQKLSGRSVRGAVLAVVLCLTACGRKSGTDALEHEHPRMKEAARLVQQQDLEGAIAIYEKLLRRDPEFATAHLQLGMAHQTLQDPVAAAYHFRRYLDQRSEGEKAKIVEQMLQSELIRLVDQHPAIRAMQPPDIIELRDENARLREQVQQTQMRLARLEVESNQSRRTGGNVENRPAVATPAPVTGGDVAASTVDAGGRSGVDSVEERVVEEARRYTVRSGDNLSVISQRMYNTPHRWREILEANRETLPTERSLRPGQILVIP